jgi:hypothetical protein
MRRFADVECQIRQLQARYADAVWRADYDAFGNCFMDDAEWRVGGRIMRGKAEILANIKRLRPMAHRILMTFRTPILDWPGGDTANTRTYVTEHNVFINGRPGASIGIYYERHVRVSGQWKFKWRLFQTHYVGTADVSGPLYTNPEWGAPPNMPLLDAPTYDHTGISAKAWEDAR